MNDSFEQRLRMVEDREAIRALKAFYARCADEKYTDDHQRREQPEIDAIARRQVDATFTPDAVWDGDRSSAAGKGARQSTTICDPAAGISPCTTLSVRSSSWTATEPTLHGCSGSPAR